MGLKSSSSEQVFDSVTSGQSAIVGYGQPKCCLVVVERGALVLIHVRAILGMGSHDDVAGPKNFMDYCS
jgi:hypothetical protein